MHINILIFFYIYIYDKNKYRYYKNKLGGNLEITNIPIKPIKLISPWNYHNRL